MTKNKQINKVLHKINKNKNKKKMQECSKNCSNLWVSAVKNQKNIKKYPLIKLSLK